MVSFLIIGPLTAIVYTNVFPLMKDEKITFGAGGVSHFNNNDVEVNCIWYTNLNEFTPELLKLSKCYDDLSYKEFDFYNAINVDRIEDIPCDYYDVMGVPVTFLNKWNKNQFELLDARDYTKYSWLKNKSTMLITDSISGKCDGKNIYCRILIRRK